MYNGGRYHEEASLYVKKYNIEANCQACNRLADEAINSDKSK